MRQYLATKREHPDALLFFRMGDFYELFFEDAVTAARALELTLTARNKGSDQEIPMAGVPHHAASSYIQRLLDQGFRVAICEQMADPATVKGLVPREVVRVVSPGIVYDDLGLSPKEHHRVVAVDTDAGLYGVASLDMSTGEFLAAEANDVSMALLAIFRFEPRELLFSMEARPVADLFREKRPQTLSREDTEPLSDPDLVLDAALGLKEAQRSCPSRVARRAAARVLRMAQAHEAGRSPPVSRLVEHDVSGTLLIDDATGAHLELVRPLDAMRASKESTLLFQLDRTRTAPGARLLRERLLAPLLRVDEIRRRQDVVEFFANDISLRTRFAELLAGTADLERLATKFILGRYGPKDLARVRDTLLALPKIALLLREAARSERLLGLEAQGKVLDELPELCTLLTAAVADDPPLRVSDGGTIRDGFDEALDEARTLTASGQRVILELEGRLREEAEIGSLKLRYTRVFGWYIEVTKAHLGKVPSAWRRKQTIAGGERFTSNELDELADKLLHAEERAREREAELVCELALSVSNMAGRLRAVSLQLAAWDVAAALADVAHHHDYVRPLVDDSSELVLAEARHPVVERLVAAGRFVPNSVTLSARERNEGKSLWLVTGPNMAGKSTLMRQVAHVVILAQMGSFVPARTAKVGVVDRILTRVGASDNVSRGESTFMVEMKETAQILRRATVRSLVLLDEIGRGTSTYDGLAIARAVAEYLSEAVGCRALFATHYHEMTELAKTHTGVRNVSVSAREHQGEIVFLHKLADGPAPKSYGVACARLAGLPEPVLARAEALLTELEKRPTEPGPQLALFSEKVHPVLALLEHVDPDRLTPIEALQFVAKMKRLLGKR